VVGQLPAERELTRCLRPSQTEEDNPNLTAGDEGLLKVTRPRAGCGGWDARQLLAYLDGDG